MLAWCQEKQSYESDELVVPCGVYSCKLAADGTTYCLEQVDVKFYTFEVDLYIDGKFCRQSSTVPIAVFR